MKFIGTLKQWFLPYKSYPSETSKVRHLVLPYCQGFGCDIGFGGDKIQKENCIGIDLKLPYAKVGNEVVDIACNLNKESIPVPNNRFDYVYSSHLIEDFQDTGKILKEFVRILKSGGNLVLVFPDQLRYMTYCLDHKQPINKSHVHQHMSRSFLWHILENILFVDGRIKKWKPLFVSDCDIDYNVVIVVQIHKF